jgi:CubicO group peptidase (beta-lactamase class C family)
MSKFRHWQTPFTSMSVPSTNRPSCRSSRRQFLATAAAGLTCWSCAGRAYSKPTGLADPKLNAYDDLMSRFMREHNPPGAALAVTYRGRLVYARGFGDADLEIEEPVRPTSLFRIASLSKPFTSAAVMQLVEQGKLKLDDPVFPILKLEPHLERGGHADPRLHDIRIHHCLQHTAGWDRKKSFDPMSAVTAERVAKTLKVPLPIHPEQIIRYTMGRPLDTDPGDAYAYSNFGYCVLGRVIEAISGQPYDEFVSRHVLAPLGIRRMRQGKNLLSDRAPDEVKYYDSKKRTGRAISGPKIGEQVPLPYGVECIETMDANGGWIASAVDLVRFAAALDDPKHCPILNEESIHAMLAPPAGAIGVGPKGHQKSVYYACGWEVRSAAGRSRKYTKWHTGMLAGSSTLLVCRKDGINWGVLFNSDAGKDGKQFASLIDPLLHQPADEIKDWPEIDLFSKF